MTTTPNSLPELRSPQADNSLRHGHARHIGGSKASPTYQSWIAMRTRCSNPKRHNAGRYVESGVRVCVRWDSFEAFLEDMGERPDGTTLDRRDSKGNYEPGNCRWATPIEQSRNRRNARLTYAQAVEVARARLGGESCPSIAARFGCSESLPREIVKGRTWKDALAEAKGVQL